MEDDSNKLIEERRAKLKALRAKGTAFPNDFARANYAGDLAASHGGATNEALEASPVKVTVAGRLMLKRVMGKACFGTIRDMTGAIQLFVSDGDTGSEALAAFKQYDLGDKRYAFALKKKRSTTGGDGEAAQVFRRRIAELAREQGYRSYEVLEFTGGIESTVPIAQRVSHGVVQYR